MAGAVAVSTGKPGKRYNAKMTGYVWFLCLIGGSGGLLLGYDNGIIGKRYLLLFTAVGRAELLFRTVLAMLPCASAQICD